MLGRIVRLFAVAAALSVLGVSAASAGWYGAGGCCGVYTAPLPAPVDNWACSTSSCAPVQWGCNSCGSSLGFFNGGCGGGCGGSLFNSGCGGCGGSLFSSGCGGGCGGSLFNSGCGGCGTSYGGYGYGGYGNGGYGYGMPAADYGVPAYQPPVRVAYQGPTYEPAVTGYTYPGYAVEEPPAYPYVARPAGYYGYRGYGYRGYGYRGYRGYGYRGYGYRGYRYGGYRGYGWRPRVAHWSGGGYGVRHYGPRYAPYRMYRGYPPLRVRGQYRGD